LYSGDDFNSGMMRAAAPGCMMKGGDFEDLSDAIRRAAAAEHS
jgi:DNA-binding NarL/FixJ family response regulator